MKRRRREAEREGREHKTTTQRSDREGKRARRVGRGFDIWTVVKEGSEASLCTHTHTQINTLTHQMGLEGLKRGYSSSLSSAQSGQI